MKAATIDELGLLRLSPFVSELETRDGTGTVMAQGIYHRLTGAAFSVAPAALALVSGLGRAPLEHDDIAAGGAELADMMIGLRSSGLLVAPAPLDRLIQAFRDYVLTRPLGNPAIVAFDDQGRSWVTRPHRLSLCALPRTQCRPLIVEEPLGRVAAQVLQLAEGRPTLGQAETTLSREGVTRDMVLSAIEFLCDPDRQLLRLVCPRVDPDDPRAPHHKLVQSIHWSLPVSSATPTHVAAGDFYRHGIEDAHMNFDWVEPTVSHAFREPTEAFGGRSYGARLGQALSPFFLQCAREHGRLRILEIGGGLGFVAQSLIKAARQTLGSEISIDYTLLDLSETLIARQRGLLRNLDANLRFVVGDAQYGLGQDVRCEFVLANEVIADFDTSAANDGSAAGAPLKHAGVQRFVDLLPRVLAPGGRALLVEYGSIDAPPEPILHLNHTEHAVDFRAVARYAERRGFRVALSPLADLLWVDDRVEMLVGQQEAMLCWNVFLAKGGRTVDYRAYDRSEFLRRYGDVLDERKVLGPPFAPLSAALHYGPDLAQFIVLDLTRVLPA